MSKQLLLTLVGQSKHELVNTFRAVPDDKLNWKPFDSGRAALDLFCEAANTFKLAGDFVASKGEEKPLVEKFKQLRAESANWTKQKALDAMEANYAAFKAAFEALDAELLETPVTMPFGGGMTLPFGVWAMIPHRTCTSRFAQINYIQTLYGDMESH